REMGASIEESEVRGDAGEPMATLRVRASKLRGVEVPPERAPSMIDEYLVLAVAAAFAEGTTIMHGLQELRVKESDRLEATADMLRVHGVKVEISGDDLIVEGRGHVPGGGVVKTHMDHRIAMSALVMGCAADKPVKVDDTAFIATSFPDFIPMMRSLGADFSEPRAVQDGGSPRLVTASSQTGASSLYSFCVSSNVIAVSSTPNDFMSCSTFSFLPPATRSFDSFSMMAAGVPIGTAQHWKPVSWKMRDVAPCSLKEGTSGNVDMRLRETATAWPRPLCRTDNAAEDLPWAPSINPP